MSQHIKLSDALDQENSQKTIQGLQKLRFNQENVRMVNKRPVSGSASQPLKRLRTPLAGKDQNLVFSSLQRSKSSVAQNQFPSSSHNVPKNQGLRPARATLNKLPTLAKSNSSLGFTHKPAKVTLSNNFRHENPHKNQIFASDDAHRPHDLVPRFATDSIKKAHHDPLPALAISLKDTLTENTHKLHASKLIEQDIHHRHGDPLKKSSASADIAREELIEELSEDPSSIEFINRPQVSELPHVPVGMDVFKSEDLEFIRTGVRRSQQVLDLSFESTWDEDNIEDEEDNLALGQEFAQQGLVGLSAEELNDLLDF